MFAHPKQQKYESYIAIDRHTSMCSAIVILLFIFAVLDVRTSVAVNVYKLSFFYINFHSGPCSFSATTPNSCELSQAGCPSCHTKYSVNALKKYRTVQPNNICCH